MVHDSVDDNKGLKDLWSNSWLKVNLICSCFVWLFGSFNFYMLTFYLKYFRTNVYVSAMCFAVADMLAYLSSGIVCNFFSIRYGLMISYGFAVIGSLLYNTLFWLDNAWFVPLVVGICRLGGSMAFNVGYVSVARLFPTEFVTAVFGIVNLCSHTIAVASPMIAEVKEPIPMVVFCCNAVLAIFFGWRLIEYEKVQMLMKKKPTSNKVEEKQID